MAQTFKLKEFFEVQLRHGTLFTGGKVHWCSDGSTLICSAGDVINVVDVDSGIVRTALGGTEEGTSDPVLSYAANESGTCLISAHRSGLIKQWIIEEGKVLKSWRSIHRGPISELAINQDGEILATAGADGVVRIWNLTHHTCTLALKGANGVISTLLMYEDAERQLVFASGDNLIIHCWDMETGELIYQLTGHYSKVTGLAVIRNGHYLVSAALDKVLMLWDLSTGTCMKTVATYQALAGVAALPKKFELSDREKLPVGLYVATAGQRGGVTIYEMGNGREIFVQKDSVIAASEDEGTLAITQVLFNPITNGVAVVSADHNIVIYRLDTFAAIKQLVGFSDEILDLVILGQEDSHIAVATNSKDIKLYNMTDLGCHLLLGHRDMVVSLAVSPANPNLMISVGKDSSVRLWELVVNLDSMKCVAVGSGHTASVTAATFTQLSADLFVTASSDTTLKLWRREGETISSRRTEVAHNKDINCVSVSPNDKIVASASQDKTIKLWELESLSLLGVLSGHRRGVWCVRFSPVDEVLVSSSADCTIKLWSVAELTCLKTFEGHESSVLRVEFISKGMQLVSCSGDGLLKLWTLKSGECSASFDGHNGKVWAMAVTKDGEKIITGGADSLLLVWNNVTEKRKVAALEEQEALLEQEQQLSNLLHGERLLEALSLALSLDRPFTVLNIVKELSLKGNDSGLPFAVSQLSNGQKEQLLKCASAWNCNGKHSAIAQAVLSLLVDELASGQLSMPGMSKFMEDVIPYTERHFNRLSSALQGLHLLQFTIKQMNSAYS